MNVSRFPVLLLGLSGAACEREGSNSLAPIAHGRTIRPGRVGHRGPVISAHRRTHRLPPDFCYRNLRAGLARNRKIELCTAESTSYGISRPEHDLVACYLCAPVPSPHSTHVYARDSSPSKRRTRTSTMKAAYSDRSIAAGLFVCGGGDVECRALAGRVRTRSSLSSDRTATVFACGDTRE